MGELESEHPASSRATSDEAQTAAIRWLMPEVYRRPAPRPQTEPESPKDPPFRALPSPMPNDTTRLMRAHRSIRRFRDEPVPDAAVREALACAQMASTSSAVQAYTLIRVSDPARRAELAELSGPQEKVARCGVFFVVCADQRRHQAISERTGRAYERTFENLLVAVIDASLFAQNLALAFESMGLGVCYIGGVRNDLPRVARVLSIPTGVFPLFGLCVGVPDESPTTRPRLDGHAVLFEDAYPSDGALLKCVDAYDALYRDYLRERGAEPKGWSDAMADRHAKPTRADVGAWFEQNVDAGKRGDIQR